MWRWDSENVPTICEVEIGSNPNDFRISFSLGKYAFRIKRLADA